MSRDRDVLAGVLVRYLVEDVSEGLACPGMPVVVMRMALVVFDRRARLAAALLEKSNLPQRFFAEVLTNVASSPEDRVPHNDARPIHRHRREPQLLNELLERIRAGAGIV